MNNIEWAFDVPQINQKLALLESNIHHTLAHADFADVPMVPSRDVLVLPTKQHPKKSGFSTTEGQARMLHDLASIELQAMELGLRTLVEFPDADSDFREALGAVTLSEGEHLKLCLEGLNTLGFEWGQWPVHCNLWTATAISDSLLDRLLIVHRYLEGSGLDAGAQILQRLRGLLVAGVSADSLSAARKAIEVLDVINREEVEHVAFGSHWYRHFCKQQKLDPSDDFSNRMNVLAVKLPPRYERINRELRLQAGFTEAELSYYESMRQKLVDKNLKV